MTDRETAGRAAIRGIRSAVRNDASAFSYSVLVTCSFGLTQLEAGPVTVPRLFLFVFGATAAFALAEAASSNLFRIRMREESSDIVVLGTALAPISVGAGLSAGFGVVQLVEGAVSWLTVPLTSTAVYIVLTGAQLTFARRYEERHPPDR